MPDQYGFNRLGPEVACVECDERGPLHDWPLEKREEHHLAHQEGATPVRAPKPSPAVEAAVEKASAENVETLEAPAPALKTPAKKTAAKKPAAKKPAAK